jgi:mannose-6-phosphate isomerase-like protein (cupin superfamily)
VARRLADARFVVVLGKAVAMAVRLVVTGIGDEGLSRVERDGPVAAEVTLSSVGGMVLTYPWQVAVPPASVADGEEPTDSVASFLPPPGSLNFIQLVVPAGYPAPRDDAAAEAVIDEINTKLPGILPTLDAAKGPGMHQTPTLDLFTVISGRLMLRLDDGSETELAPGDCLAQRGTMHAWHNPTDEPCTVSGVMIALGPA